MDLFRFMFGKTDLKTMSLKLGRRYSLDFSKD